MLLAVISEFALPQEEAAQVLAGDAFADEVKRDILKPINQAFRCTFLCSEQ
ncbi:MAG: hypothetical protein ACLR3O_02815 [Streptococcus sp.]